MPTQVTFIIHVPGNNTVIYSPTIATHFAHNDFLLDQTYCSGVVFKNRILTTCTIVL